MIVNASGIQWKRIAAFVAGSSAVILALWWNPFEFFPDPIAAASSSIPVAMCIYGVTGRSWRESAVQGAAVGVGLGIGTYVGY